MNERIKELEAECWDYARGTVNTQKFAELIVKRCAEVADQYVWDGDFDIAELIRRHFGVKK
jgi:hypothetical protein